MQRLILLFLCAALPVCAQIDLRTNIRDMDLNRGGATAGAISFTVRGDDFATASVDEPVYLRIRLSHAAVLCQTLVGAEDAPIYMPVRLEGGLSTETIAADPTTAAIVRWRQGEDQIWVRIQSSSSTWINSAVGLIPPDVTRPVSFTLGVSARTSDQANNSQMESPDDFNANLPYHTRFPDAPVDPAYSLSTVLCVDLSNSNLESVPVDEAYSVLSFDPSAWVGTQGLEAAQSTAAIRRGQQAALGFSSDTRIGRGFDFDEPCQLSLQPIPAAPNASVTGAKGSVSCALRDFAFQVSCPGGFDPVNRNTLWELEIQNASAGFPIAVDGEGQGVPSGDGFLLLTGAWSVSDANWSAPIALAQDIIEVNGLLVATKARMTYEAEGQGPNPYDFPVSLTLCGDLSSSASLLSRVSLTQHGSFIENPEPYDQPGQEDFCPAFSEVLELVAPLDF